MTDTSADSPGRVRILFRRPMRDLPDVFSALSAIDTLWVCSYDFAQVLAADGVSFGIDGDTLFQSTGELSEFQSWVPRIAGSVFSEGSRFDVPRPTPLIISMRSPLWIELLADLAIPGGLGLSAYAIFRTALKNPSQIGGFVPSLFDSWNSGWASNTRSRTDRLRARDEAAAYLVEREALRTQREAISRMAQAGHLLSDAGMVVGEPSDEEPIT